MTITINELVSGQGLIIDNDLYLVQEYHHVKPGKGSAFVRVKLRNIKTDTVIERTFRTADKLDEAPLEEKELEYLYHTGNDYCFMDHTSYDQIHLSESEVGDAAAFLLENLAVTGLSHNTKIVKVVLPNFIEACITETEPGIKGDSSRAGTKPAKIETGTVIQVPLFVNAGDWIKIDTRSRTYVERLQR